MATSALRSEEAQVVRGSPAAVWNVAGVRLQRYSRQVSSHADSSEVTRSREGSGGGSTKCDMVTAISRRRVTHMGSKGRKNVKKPKQDKAKGTATPTPEPKKK